MPTLNLSSGVRLMGVFAFCMIANYIIAHDNPQYLLAVSIGNVQIIVFFGFVWAVEQMTRWVDKK